MAGRDFFEFSRQLGRQRQPSAPSSGAGGGTEAWSVAELTSRIDGALRSGLPPRVLVRGEVSNFKPHNSSGHLYFTLKDAQACVDCVMFRSDAAKVRFTPADGMEVLATGRVAVYSQRGRYQLYVSSLEPMGAGALELAFRQLCEKLRVEGLFEANRKKSLPAYPMRVALVTSRATAALQDMLKVLRRYPWLELLLYDVPVQGAGAAPAIAAALETLATGAASIGGVDVILLARGGGSLEDLWAFNEEIVARAIAACGIPVISGIGHEIDVSVADMVADYHAHTPTEAAQVATANWRNAAEAIEVSRLRMSRAVRSLVQEARQRLARCSGHEFFRRPGERVNQARQRLDDLGDRLLRAAGDRIAAGEERLDRLDRQIERSGRSHLRQALTRLAELELRLGRRSPGQIVASARERLLGLEGRLRQSVHVRLAAETRQLASLERQLEALSPQRVLQRGYSITTLKKKGEVLRSKSQIRGGERLLTHLADGSVESIAEDPNQPSLF